MRRESYNGSEIHRLKPMKSYDNKVFMKMYNLCKPVIKNLVYHIDYRRFNLTQDIIESYFWDKMLYVFNKYYDSSTEEHLKARILASLSTYKISYYVMLIVIKLPIIRSYLSWRIY